MNRHRHRPSRRSVLIAGAALIVISACAASSSGSESSPVTGDVEIVVDLQGGQRWTATGPLVDSGSLCPEGTRMPQGYFDPDSRELLTPSELDRRAEEETDDQWEAFPLIGRIEHACLDGSGSFVLEQHFHEGVVTVLSGTGAYRTISGGGTMSFTAEPTPEYDADQEVHRLRLAIEAPAGEASGR